MKTHDISENRFKDLRPRVISAVILAAVALALIWLGGVWVTALVAATLVAMFWEYNRMLGATERASTIGFAIITAGIVAAVFATGSGLIVVGFAVLAVALLVAAIRRENPEWLIGGAAYMGFAVCGLLALRSDAVGGFSVVVWLILVVVAADVGAYFTGRYIGGPKLWPAVSPGKTWSGAIGGLGMAAVTGAVFALFVGWSMSCAFWISVLVAIGSQCGDLLESAIKRRHGVKDSSNLIPGHGGVLDRLDGVLGGAWVYIILHVLGYGLGGQ